MVGANSRAVAKGGDAMNLFWGPSLYRLLVRADERSWTWRIATLLFWLACMTLFGVSFLLIAATIAAVLP